MISRIIMNFAQSVKTCFKKYFTFSGRASRSEYWNFYSFILLFNFIILMSLFFSGIFWVISTVIFGIFTFIPSLSVQARRLHDINRSGWWALPFIILSIIFSGVALLPLLPLLIWSAKKGSLEENRFGPPVS
jgi:uncharacterized membrane protein YhaH (DUF805 family)